MLPTYGDIIRRLLVRIPRSSIVVVVVAKTAVVVRGGDGVRCLISVVGVAAGDGLVLAPEARRWKEPSWWWGSVSCWTSFGRAEGKETFYFSSKLHLDFGRRRWLLEAVQKFVLKLLSWDSPISTITVLSFSYFFTVKVPLRLWWISLTMFCLSFWYPLSTACRKFIYILTLLYF